MAEPQHARMSLARRVIVVVLRTVGVLLLIPTVVLIFLALYGIITGDDGFTDAAPWWAFFLVLAVCIGVPAAVLLLVARLVARRPKAGATA